MQASVIDTLFTFIRDTNDRFQEVTQTWQCLFLNVTVPQKTPVIFAHFLSVKISIHVRHKPVTEQRVSFACFLAFYPNTHTLVRTQLLFRVLTPLLFLHNSTQCQGSADDTVHMAVSTGNHWLARVACWKNCHECVQRLLTVLF